MTGDGPLARLAGQGVSIWLDALSRDMLDSGSLARLADHRHVTGVTSNPAIFEQAIGGSRAYAGQVRDLAIRGIPAGEAARLLTAYDVSWACDMLREIYDRTDGLDGRVSIEVDPRAAADTARTVAEARALHGLVERPNVMVKVPATVAGLAAITRATAEGISINVTLIFGLDRYEQVMDAFMTGLETAADAGLDLSGIRSVASFFVSRVDTETDARLEVIGTRAALALRGQAAIANARLAYQRYQAVIRSERWQRLEALGARRQRPLWASTGVKNPAYPDTQYVTTLVAPDTVSTMPEVTLDAVADHGKITGDTVTAAYNDATRVMTGLAAAGVDYDDVVALLEREGVAKFTDAWTRLLGRLDQALEAARSGE
ncbi:MAG TPA: transaldolase [Trebonia sp.]|jgi:transaldolase